MIATDFRTEMIETVQRRHCERHPLTEAWARGDLSREQLGRAMVEMYHYTWDVWRFIGRIVANCPIAEVRRNELANLAEEEDPLEPHNQQLLDFIAACGLDPHAAVQTPPLPTTQAHRDWLRLLCEHRTWQEAIGGFHIAMEWQLAGICARLVPALREHYQFEPRAIRYFVTHEGADEEHGSLAMDGVEKYTPPELRPKVLAAIEEATMRRWFFFDGIYVKWVLGYNLGEQR
jgi:pyrroloquinoline-quinone synthase